MVGIVEQLIEMGKEAASTSADFLEAVVLNPIRKLPLDQQYNALKNLGQSPEVFNKLDEMPTGLQQSFAHAYLNNANFRDYLTEAQENAVEGQPSLASAVFENLYKDDIKVDGKPVIDPQKVSAVQGILTTIGNDPEYDLKQVDAVVSTLEEGKALLTAAKEDGSISQEERAALDANQKAIYRALRTAGADIPAFANMDIEMFMDFLTTLMEQGFDAAISGLITDLDIEGTPEAESLTNLAGKVAPFAKFMAQPYYDVVQEHGDNAIAGAKDLMQDVKIVAGSNPKEIITPEAGTEVTASITQLFGGTNFGALTERLGVDMDALGKFNPFFNTSAVGEVSTREAAVANSPQSPEIVIDAGAPGFR
jgi:hypothetical protein